MVDREKVIKGLECLSNPYVQDMDERDCENCKYDNASCFLDVTADALSLLKAQEPGWISVKDFLPEKTGSTLICTKNGAVCTAKYYKGQQEWNGYAGGNAAYWMPLPEPPKEET